MRPASLRLVIIVAGSIGLISYAIADPGAVSPGNSNFGAQSAPSGAPSSTSNSSSSPNSSGSSSSGDENPNVAGNDADGLPILKTKPGIEHEKIIQLKDGQKLPTSGIDPKFQGSLLNTSVDSIVSLARRKDKDAAAAKVNLRLQTADPSPAKDGAEPRKKSEPVYTRSSENPSPTPTPSATASPTAKVSSGRTP
jgi:hypothetical protein